MSDAARVSPSAVFPDAANTPTEATAANTDPIAAARGALKGKGVERADRDALEERVVFVLDDELRPFGRRRPGSWLVTHEHAVFERTVEDGETYQRMLVEGSCPTCGQRTKMVAGPWRTLFGELP